MSWGGCQYRNRLAAIRLAAKNAGLTRHFAGIAFQHFTEEKNYGVEGLALRGCGHAFFHGQIGQPMAHIALPLSSANCPLGSTIATPRAVFRIGPEPDRTSSTPNAPMLPIVAALIISSPSGVIGHDVLHAFGTFLFGLALPVIEPYGSPLGTMASADSPRGVSCYSAKWRSPFATKHEPGKSALLPDATAAFTSATEPSDFAVWCQLVTSRRLICGSCPSARRFFLYIQLRHTTLRCYFHADNLRWIRMP